MNNRFLLIIFFTNLITLQGFSGNNTATITGNIRDQQAEPVPYATLMLLDEDSMLVKADYSREDGTFEFRQIPAGAYQIKVRSVQYEPFISKLFQVNEGQNLSLDPITIAESVQQLEEIEVTAAKPLVEVHPDKTVFNIATSAVAAGTDALEMLRKAPGVIIDNNDNVILQGKSGVKIYIVGKPSHLKGEDLVNLLRNMQSDAVESVEIITNPPARYDAEGNAGIINIKLKRDKNLGMNASLTAGYNVGELESYHGNTHFNYRNRKINVFGHFNYYDNNGFSTENHYKQMDNVFLDQKSKVLWDWNGYNFRLGADYQLNPKHLVGFIANGNINEGDIDVTSNTPFGNRETDEVEQILNASSERNTSTDNMNINLNYVFSGEDASKLNVDADYGYFYKNSLSDQANIYLDRDGELEIERSLAADDQSTRIDIRTLKFDYERPVGPGTLSFGGKYSDVTTDNGFLFYRIIDEEKAIDNQRSNDFNYSESVTAGYVNYQAKLSEKLSVNGGVRVEHTASEGVLESAQQNHDDHVARDYADVFPSGGISYKLNDKNTVALNYSRRINRPGYEQLNPFEFQLDELTYRKGNPFLKPQYGHNMQLSYVFNHNLNVQFSYSVASDYFAQILDTIGQRGWMISVQNMAEERNMGMNISYSLDLIDKWNLYLNNNLYSVSYLSDIPGKDINLDQTVYNAYAKTSYRFPAGFDVEVSGWYNSPSIWGGTFKMESQWAMDAGIKKSLWDNRAIIKASVSDIFSTNKWNGKSSYDGLEVTSAGSFDSRQMRLSLTYNLGNQQVKTSRKRATGLEEEKNRLNKE